MFSSPASGLRKPGTITWRTPDEDDLPACLAVSLGSMGDELTGSATALRVWREMLHHPAMITAVFECEPPVEGRRIIGFGAAAFVTKEFTDSEIANPRPMLNARIVDAVHGGRPVLLSRQEIARANAGGGLDLAQLYGSWAHSILHPEEVIQVQTQLGVSLAQLIAGYKINRIFAEAIGDMLRFIRRAGVRELATFPELDRAITLATRREAMEQPFALSRAFFSSPEPVLGLSPAEQELLWMAQEGQTDPELARSLRLTLPAVKARWRSVLAKFADRAPGVARAGGNTTGRGPQRRHRILAWLREHPEELRPYEPPSSTDS